MTSTPDISIIIPLYNEEESLEELYGRISRVLEGNGLSGEVIFVDDGSTDGSWSVVERLAAGNDNVKGIRFRRNFGKSAALNCGFEEARAAVVITLDADLQDSPEEIPALYKMIREEGYDLVSGWKKKRHDPLIKSISSRLFNRATRTASGIKLHDFNCGLKAYRLEVVKSIEVYGEMHRYIPVIAHRAGFTRISEKVVKHSPRRHGKTKFGIERFINGFLDLLSILFVTRFGRQPMHLFGMLGTLMFFIGLVGTLWLGIEKLWYLRHGIPAPLITNQPLFYIALTTMILGTQLFLAGFLGELISRASPERNKYLMEKKI